MSNTHCAICNEPWDVYGLAHGDVAAWEADMIKEGKGCPSCKGFNEATGIQNPEYKKPNPLEKFQCTCCQKTISIDQDEIRYNGVDKEYDEELATFHTDSSNNKVCDSCYEQYYSRCDKCNAVVHQDDSNYFQSLDTYGVTLCEECTDQVGTCDKCGSTCWSSELKHFEEANKHLCDTCYDSEIIECPQCETLYYKPNGHEGYCSNQCRKKGEKDAEDADEQS